ncbi:MAG: hypothetical protein RJA22_3364 [Verrucomicrobiota bacterium]
MTMSLLEELQWRGLLQDCTDAAALGRRLAEGPLTLYCGFDPTADSLHVGSLVPLLALRRFQRAGHRPIALAGGATGFVGDPSGRTSERQLLTREALDANIAGLKPQLARLLDFQCADNPARLVDNAEWTAPMTYLDFLRDVGKHFTVNMMVAKESVRARMEDREHGISYTEFSYMLLQAHDFYHLCKEAHCELQIGGSDQWGNITAGLDLCRKKLGRHVFGLTLPLVTKADGGKFGKSESGNVWLDARKTSPYKFFQFWVNTEDAVVVRYLKYFTFLSREAIEALAAEQAAKPESRVAQKALAREMTTLLHGETACTEAQRASEILFGGGLEGVSEATLREILGEVPSAEVDRARLAGAGLPLVELLVHAGLCASKGQARKDVEGGGIYVNNVREAVTQRAIQESDLLFGKHLLLRKGKRNYSLVTVR